ncbi:MAG: hypothetical protein R3C01_00465 [Planctomycetaceae bacterium]
MFRKVNIQSGADVAAHLRAVHERFRPRSVARPLMVMLLLLAGMSAGCQCCPWTERWSRCVDHLAGQEHYAEDYYCEPLDVTRINRPGGLSCQNCETVGTSYYSTPVYANRFQTPPPR